MTSRPKIFQTVLLVSLILFLSREAWAQEIFIYRPKLEKDSASVKQKITLHGEFFGHLQSPSTFPSYNDLSGPVDRWNFGFQNIIHFTDTTRFMAQLFTHDDGQRRTKFDWHFSLRQNLFENLVIFIGHDSNHDSDYQSQLDGQGYFLNRNYIGIGIPFEKGSFYFEPFTWLHYNSNQRGHLDLSGEKVRQEYGLRLGYWHQNTVGIHVQIYAQSEAYFAVGQTFIADVIIRIRLFKFLELSIGSSIWKDIEESRMGNKDRFRKLIWGLVFPF